MEGATLSLYSPKQTDKRIVIKEQKKVQQVTPDKSVKTRVTVILAHMSHLMKTVDTIKELIKALRREPYNKEKIYKPQKSQSPKILYFTRS